MSSFPANSAPSFAESLREQDELFYAVFPQARSNQHFDFHIGYTCLANNSSEPPVCRSSNLFNQSQGQHLHRHG